MKFYSTKAAVCSRKSGMTDTSKPFTGEANLTSSVIETWVATTWILLKERIKMIGIEYKH